MPNPLGYKYETTRTLLEWFRRQQPFEDKSGRASTRAYEAAQADGVYSAGMSGFSRLLQEFDRDGVIIRQMNGKRTFRIEVLDPLPMVEVVESEMPGAAEYANGHAVEQVIEVAQMALPTEPVPAAEEIVNPPVLQGDEPTVTVNITINWTGTMADMPERLVALAQQQGGDPLHAMRDTIKVEMQRLEHRYLQFSNAAHDADQEEIRELQTAINQLAAKVGEGPMVAHEKRKQSERPTAKTVDFRSLGVKDSGQKKLMRELAGDGWEFKRTGSGHIQALKDGYEPVTMPATPSDWRSALNTRAEFRRRGVAV